MNHRFYYTLCITNVRDRCPRLNIFGTHCRNILAAVTGAMTFAVLPPAERVVPKTFGLPIQYYNDRLTNPLTRINIAGGDCNAVVYGICLVSCLPYASITGPS